MEPPLSTPPPHDDPPLNLVLRFGVLRLGGGLRFVPPPPPVPLRSWRPQPEIDQKHRGAIQREREEEREGARERYKGKMVVRHIWAERGKSV